MPVPILDIKVNDAQFKSFSELFDKYQAALARMPQAWRGVNKEMKTSFENVASAMLAQAELTKRMALAEKTAVQDSHRHAMNWKEIAQHTKEAAGRIKEATIELLKWTEITGALGGLLGIGGLWGLEHLATTVATGRKSALGLGLTFGEHQAFDINYGRLLDTSTFLSGVAGALHDPTQRVGLYGAGLTPAQMTGGTAAVSSRLLEQLKRLADQNDPASYGRLIQSRHLEQFGITTETLTRLHALSPEEFKTYQKGYAADVAQLRVSDEAARKWQDLSVQLTRAGTKIEDVLIKGLSGLAGPLDHLSAAVSNAVSAFLSSPALTKWIDKLGEALEALANYMSDDQFQKDVETFAEDIGILAHKVGEALKWLGIIPDHGDKGGAAAAEPPRYRRLGTWETMKATAKAQADLEAAQRSGDKAAIARANAELTAAQQGIELLGPARQTGDVPPAVREKTVPPAVQEMMRTGTVTGADLLPLVRKLERSADTAISPAGAIGRYQITPDTARTYGGDPTKLMLPDYETKLAQKILDDLLRKYHGNVAEVLAAYNAGPEGSRSFREHGDDPRYLPFETQSYLRRAQRYTEGSKVVVEINNNTGGQVTIQTAQVAH